MDKGAIDLTRLKAGEEYLSALRGLGLEPDALFWAWVRGAEEGPILFLVTRFYDAVGPMELQSLLFKAYNAAATPREIDPFIVRLHSPRHRIIRELSGNLDRMGKWVGAAREGPNAETILRNLSIVSIVQEIADLNVPVGQIYKFHLPGKDSIDWASRWKAITKRVDKLAA